jgi:PAS domain S-box-containing protein
MTRDEAIAALNAVLDRLERAEREGAQRFEAAFASTPPGVGVHELDLDHAITRVSPEELRLLGYRREQMVGRPAWEFIVMKEASQRAITEKLTGKRELKPFVRSFQRADGSAIAMLLVDRHLRDAKGRIVGIRTAMTETKPE